MRLRTEDLSSHLERRGLAGLYLLCGDEPLQMGEALDTLRGYARSRGITERIVLAVEPGFDWNRLGQEAESLSLFSTHRLIELRLGNATPGKEGGEALRAYAERMPPDVTLLVNLPALDKKAQGNAWFKAVDKAGVVIQIWPVEARALPQWIQRRAASQGLDMGPDVAAFIAERVEGNLLAASQEIALLRLLTPSSPHPSQGGGRVGVSLEEAMAALSDSSRYDVFALVDGALLGDVSRTLRILEGLRSEGVEPAIVNWALTREVRSLCLMAGKMASGESLDAVMDEFRIWEKRQPLIKKALRRYTQDVFRRLLLAVGRIDKTIKGVVVGDAWEELAWLCAALAGKGETLTYLQSR
jgi:DNA polymerase-3 subunit delta